MYVRICPTILLKNDFYFDLYANTEKIIYPGGITFELIFDTRRAKDETLFPVKYRITYLRKQTYYNSWVNLTREEWEVINTTKKPNLVKKRGDIQLGYQKINDHINSLIGRDGDGFTFAALNNRLKGALSKSVIQVMLDRSDKLRLEGRISTADWLKYSSVSIKSFQDRS